MAGRPTPFGLFAGCSLGDASPEGGSTELHLRARSSYRRDTRLDMLCLSRLVQELAGAQKLWRSLPWRPNSSLHQIGNRWHLVASEGSGDERTSRLVAVDDSPALQRVLRSSRSGADFETLVAALAHDGEAPEEAESFLAAMINGQLLVSPLSPLTLSDPFEALLAVVDGLVETLAGALRRLRQSLATLDAGGLGATPHRYQETIKELRPFITGLERLPWFQVDMMKPVDRAVLAGLPLNEILRGVHLLHALTSPPEQEDLIRFREEFVCRFGDEEVPLARALNDEVGIGFGTSAPGAGLPVTDGLRPEAAGDAKIAWGGRQQWMLRKLAEALSTGAEQIDLSEDDIAVLRDPGALPLPASFVVRAAIAAPSDDALARGNFSVLVEWLLGPSAARLFGRFCHADTDLRRAVEDHLRADEDTEPGAIFAEVVHLPAGRVGNVLLRPRLRCYEIEYLGRSSAEGADVLDLDDLRVAVREGQVVLRSQRLNRVILPRLSTAHNYRMGLPVYRFLCALQDQGVAGNLAWHWRPLDAAPFLPRVRSGRVVLARARWRLDASELSPLISGSMRDRRESFVRLRAQRSLPRLFVLSDGDNELLVDAENALSLDSVLDVLRGRREAFLTEMFPGTDALCTVGPEGHFTHELLVPFLAQEVAPVFIPVPNGARPVMNAGHVGNPGLPGGVERIQRRLPPGSEWFFAKVYAGPAEIDRLLTDAVAPLLACLTDATDTWFFVRYADPQWHLRLRFHGEEKVLYRDVLPALKESLEPFLSSGLAWRFELGTYEREIERYGGPEAIGLAERIFGADSTAVLSLLTALAAPDDSEHRLLLSLVGLDRLLGDLGFDVAERAGIVRRLRADLAARAGPTDSYRERLSVWYRAQRVQIDNALAVAGDNPSPLASAAADVFADRSEAVTAAARDLRSLEARGRVSVSLAAAAAGYLHMHVNRMLRHDHLAQELLIYDVLDRYYRSRAAREHAAMEEASVAPTAGTRSQRCLSSAPGTSSN